MVPKFTVLNTLKMSHRSVADVLPPRRTAF
jgi:hypothetical protein